MSPARAGSFNANFSPETLESFKSLCRDQSKQYTKVLERLAELYLGSQGQILDNLSESPELELNRDTVDLEKLKQSVEQLETMTSIHQEDFNELVNQMQELTGRIKKLEARLRFHLSSFYKHSKEIKQLESIKKINFHRTNTQLQKEIYDQNIIHNLILNLNQKNSSKLSKSTALKLPLST